MEGHEFLFRQVLCNWYDRDEDDSEIVAEMAAEGGMPYLVDAAAAIRRFLEDARPAAEKSAAVREEVWRVMPAGETGPLEWLAAILHAVEARLPASS